MVSFPFAKRVVPAGRACPSIAALKREDTSRASCAVGHVDFWFGMSFFSQVREIPSRRAAALVGGSGIVTRGSLSPHRGSRLPRVSTRLPHARARLPHGGSRLPPMTARLPRRGSHAPHASRRVPHRGGRVPRGTAAGPRTRPRPAPRADQAPRESPRPPRRRDARRAEGLGASRAANPALLLAAWRRGVVAIPLRSGRPQYEMQASTRAGSKRSLPPRNPSSTTKAKPTT